MFTILPDRGITKIAETALVSAICGVLPLCLVTPERLWGFILCADNQIVDTTFLTMYILGTRQNFIVLRHFSSDSAKVVIFADVHEF